MDKKPDPRLADIVIDAGVRPEIWRERMRPKPLTPEQEALEAHVAELLEQEKRDQSGEPQAGARSRPEL